MPWLTAHQPTARPVSGVQGKVAPNVSVLLGSNSREGSMLMPGLGIRVTDRDTLRFWFQTYFGNASADKLTSLYAVPDDGPPPPHTWNSGDELAAQYAVGDYLLGCPTEHAASQLVKQGHAVYRYFFSHTPLFSINTKHASFMGAFHGAEVPYVLWRRAVGEDRGRG